jgi:hypothetical protein
MVVPEGALYHCSIPILAGVMMPPKVPAEPAGPVGPVAPVAPFVPFAPVAPVAPAGPTRLAEAVPFQE